MRKLLFTAVLCIIALASCNRQKSYNIQGSFDIPEELAYGDTVMERGPLDGMYVYMVDLDGMTIDSALVENETFSFSGKTPEAFFAYIICDYLYDMIVVEPGDIELTITDSYALATGTPINDEINQFHLTNSTLSNELDETLTAISNQYNGFPADSLIQEVYDRFTNRLLASIDSVYTANKDNLAGVYVVNLKTSAAQSLDEFEAMLSEYDEYVSQSPLMDVRREYLKALEAQQMFYDMQNEAFEDYDEDE